MRALIVDDQYVCRRILQTYLTGQFETEAVSTGEDALIAYALAIDDGKPFQLVCLDIEMPGKDGHETLRALRAAEASRGIFGAAAAKVIMVTAQDDPRTVFAAFRDQCEAYLVKPVDRAQLDRELRNLRLIPAAP